MEHLDEYKKNHKTAYLAEMYEKLVKDEGELLMMVKEAEKNGDASMKELAEADILALAEQKKTIEGQIKTIIESEKEEEELPVEMILEVRAAAGGDEAAIFARELLEMYQRYAGNKRLGNSCFGRRC